MKYLEDIIVKEGIINDDNVLEVDSFLNQKLDIDLLNKCQMNGIIGLRKIRLQRY